jgi:hypothetical protein
MSDEEPVEIEALEWDADSFTIEGMNPQLQQRLIRNSVTPLILLRNHDGSSSRRLRNVRITNMRTFQQTSRVETATGRVTLQNTVFWYEELPDR